MADLSQISRRDRWHRRPGGGGLFVLTVLALAVVGIAAGPVWVAFAVPAGTVPADRDSTIKKNPPTTSSKNANEGANPQLFVNSKRRTVVGFPIIGSLPVSSAILHVTIATNGNNWGTSGRLISIHALSQTFTEGNGKNIEVADAESTRGTGAGVTWNCAIDTDIADTNADCDPKWSGGAFDPIPTDQVLIVNDLTGPIQFDVTADVINGIREWIIKLDDENEPGRLSFTSKEGGSASSPAPFIEIDGSLSPP
jgi:hypothetical protein